MTDPYKVLGVSPGATKDDIKKAYRQMAKKYHPDLHPDDPVAAEKMHEINEAYDILSNPEKYAKANTGYNSTGNPYSGYSNGYNQTGSNGYTYTWTYGPFGGAQNSSSKNGYQQYTYYGNFEDLFGFGGFRTHSIPAPQAQPDDSEDLRQAIDFINMGQYSYAMQTLNSIVSADRSARWYYLSALTNYGLRNFILAMEQIQKAVSLDPSNATYQTLLSVLSNPGARYAEAGREYQRMNPGLNSMCMNLCLLQFFCMFCGC